MKNQIMTFTFTEAWSDGFTDDVTAQVTWTSSDPAVAKVVAPGQVQGLQAFGQCTLTVTLGALSDSTPISVTPGG
jgi:hypothetical protein